MSMESKNYFEAELLDELSEDIASGNIHVLTSADEHFAALSARYPICGSKIAWSRIVGSIERSERRDDFEFDAFVDFFNEMIALNGLNGAVIYIGDGLINFALDSSIEIFSKKLKEIFSIPQHHYFLAPDYSWCMVFSMEGDMSYGCMPKMPGQNRDQ